ncbi:hypothetical protein AB0H17_11190 [Streptomyces olivoreticuli]
MASSTESSSDTPVLILAAGATVGIAGGMFWYRRRAASAKQ